ncbi:MAG: hypothetical protein LBH37_00175 [Oscillospiraceae bacterium]|nr:hypothetical protein [Oscillospiraceae bacterium]
MFRSVRDDKTFDRLIELRNGGVVSGKFFLPCKQILAIRSYLVISYETRDPRENFVTRDKLLPRGYIKPNTKIEVCGYSD